MPTLAELTAINGPAAGGGISLNNLLYPTFRSVAPFGARYGGQGAKSKGYFGILGRPDGTYSSELSAESPINGKNVEYPLLVPTLSKDEIQQLLNGAKPSEQIYRKAEDYAVGRLRKGLNPFAQPNELHYPVPNY